MIIRTFFPKMYNCTNKPQNVQLYKQTTKCRKFTIPISYKKVLKRNVYSFLTFFYLSLVYLSTTISISGKQHIEIKFLNSFQRLLAMYELKKLVVVFQ